LQVAILILLISLIVAPVLVRLLESLRYEQIARAVACIGYLWMAFVFLFFVINLSFDLVRLLYKMFGAGPPLKTLFFGLSVLLSVFLVVYGYFEAQNIRVRHLEIATERILPRPGKLRIVQISDVHVGIIIREQRLDRLLQLVREAAPDVLVCTGDLLTESWTTSWIMQSVSRTSRPLMANSRCWVIMNITPD